ncbi:MAG: TetR/AcrR family transcriptional regulator [Acidimicrobiales bacterium]
MQFSGSVGEVEAMLETSRRERKKQATRQAIHEAALALSERDGFTAVTVEAITDRADVSPRTFWSYFSSKEDAVLDRDPGRPEALRQALLARPAGEGAFTALRRVLEADAAERVVDGEHFMRRMDLVRREPRLMSAVAITFEEIERALVSAVADRTGRDPEADVFPGVVVSAACGACRVAYVHWREGQGSTSLQSLLDETFEAIGGGLAARRAGRAAR